MLLRFSMFVHCKNRATFDLIYCKQRVVMRIKSLIFNVWLVLLVSLLLSNLGLAQTSEVEKPKRFSDKLFYGGSLGLMFGNFTQVDINPVGGIWIIPQWSVGVGGRYSYYSQRTNFIGTPTQVYRSHLWGGSVFTQILPVPDFSEISKLPFKGGILFHAEYEKLYIDRRILDPILSVETGKTWVNLILIGGGYRQRIGDRAAFNVMVLWQIAQGGVSPYPQNPLLRVNITF